MAPNNVPALIAILLTLGATIWLSGCASPDPPVEADPAPEEQTLQHNGTVVSRCTVNGHPCDAPAATTKFSASLAQPFDWTIDFDGGRLRLEIDLEASAFHGFDVDGATCKGSGWNQIGTGSTQVDCGDRAKGNITLTIRPGGHAQGTLTVKGASA